MLKLTYLSHFLPKQLAQHFLDPSFLLYLLPLESVSKLHVLRKVLPTDFPIYPVLTTPVWVIPQFECALCIPKTIPTTSIHNHSVNSALIIL